jgi:hypothetical protein
MTCRLRARGASIVLLAPSSLLPIEDPEVVPAGIPQRSWQAVGRIVGQLLRGEHDPVKRFLLRELLDMNDERLTGPEVARPEHLVALAYADEAEQALIAVCERASKYIAEHWRKAEEILQTGRKRTPAFGWDYWEAWSLDGADELADSCTEHDSLALGVLDESPVRPPPAKLPLLDESARRCVRRSTSSSYQYIATISTSRSCRSGRRSSAGMEIAPCHELAAGRDLSAHDHLLGTDLVDYVRSAAAESPDHGAAARTGEVGGENDQ